MDDYRAWKTLAPTGLLLVGLGVSVIADAAVRRGAGVRTAAWFAEGTVGLLAVNSGISLFGEAVKRRAVHDVRAEGEREARPVTAAPREPAHRLP